MTTAQTGSFTAEWDVTVVPGTNTKTDAVVGLTATSANNYDWADFAVAIRFGTTGYVEARNGGSYAATTTLQYSTGTRYHLRAAVDVATHKYSVWVTPAGSATETQIANNYDFRTMTTMPTSLGYSAARVQTGNVLPLKVCNFAIQ
jgi:hypothetical protein